MTGRIRHALKKTETVSMHDVQNALKDFMFDLQIRAAYVAQRKRKLRDEIIRNIGFSDVMVRVTIEFKIIICG